MFSMIPQMQQGQGQQQQGAMNPMQFMMQNPGLASGAMGGGGGHMMGGGGGAGQIQTAPSQGLLGGLGQMNPQQMQMLMKLFGGNPNQPNGQAVQQGQQQFMQNLNPQSGAPGGGQQGPV